jgi:protein ImuB
MVACVHIPRFALRAALREELGGAPAALAPAPGGRQVLGEVSSAAQARGLSAGMVLGEALARCPELRLLSPDPVREAELWEVLLARLEGIGAALESERPGEAFFATEGLRRLHGGGDREVLAAARAAAVLPVRLAVAPGRFAAALAAARGARLPRAARESPAEAIVPARALATFLGLQPIGALRGRLAAPEREQDELIGALRRLGIGTLARLAGLGAAQISDRFGPLGRAALGLARGEDTPLRPRAPREDLLVELELPEGCAGHQLERALELLVGRLLADPRRRARTLISVRLSARLCGGGSWSAEQVLSRPSASAATLAMLLSRRLEELPGPAEALGIRALAFGPQGGDQLELAVEERRGRRGKIAAAVREVRAASGAEALLALIEVDGGTLVPERRHLLVPYPER